MNEGTRFIDGMCYMASNGQRWLMVKRGFGCIKFARLHPDPFAVRAIVVLMDKHGAEWGTLGFQKRLFFKKKVLIRASDEVPEKEVKE